MKTTTGNKTGLRTLLTVILALSLCLSLLLPMGAFAADSGLKLTDVSYDGGVKFAFDCDSNTLFSLCQAGVGVTVNGEEIAFNPNYGYHYYYSEAGKYIKESGLNALYFSVSDFQDGDNAVVITDPDGVAAAYTVTMTTTTEIDDSYWWAPQEKTVYSFTFTEAAGEQPSETAAPSAEPTAQPSEVPSEPVDGTVLYVRLNGGFEHRIVGEEDIADATSAATGASYAVINEGNTVTVQAALVPAGTAFADVAESAWTSLEYFDHSRVVTPDGAKCKVTVSPAGSGVSGEFDMFAGTVSLSGTPAKAGDYTVTLSFTDTEGRTAVSNSVDFKIYSGDETLRDQLILDNCSQTADGKYIYDMEPWYIHDFGGDQSVTVPTDVKAWYGSHTRGTYGELGEIISLTNGDAPVQELIIPAGCNLTMVNMRVHSGVKIVVEDGAAFSIRDTIIEGILEVRSGGTFSADYNDFGDEAGFLYGSSINGQLQLLDGATIANARIVSHTNYSARDDQNRKNFAPVVYVTGSVNMVGDVYISGDEAPNDGHGQPGLYIVNGTLNVPAGSTLAVFGGGSSMLTPEGGDAIILDNGTIAGAGKVIAVGGYCMNITANDSYGHGGAAVSGTGVIAANEAYLEGGSSYNAPAAPISGSVTLSDATNRNLVDGIQTDSADTATRWVGTGDLDGTIPVLANYPVPQNAPGEQAAFAVTAQPKDYTGAVNSTAKFTVKATGDGLTYRWEYSDDNGATWLPSTLKSATYSAKLTAEKNGRMVRCIVTDENNHSFTTEPAAMKTTLTVTAQPEDYTGAVNSTAKFTVKATGAGLTYRWEYSDDNGETWLPSTLKTAVYSAKLTAEKNGRVVRCVITDANGSTFTTKPAAMRIALTLTAQPQDYVGKVNSVAKFTVKASGVGLTYQWQYSDDNGATWLFSTLKSATYSAKFTAEKNGRMVRCVITDANGNSLTTDPASMTIG